MASGAAKFNAAPLLETERLRLRAHRVEDFAASLAVWSDSDVVRFIGGVPLDGEAVWKRLLQHAGLWSLLGVGSWAVEEKSSGDYIGDIGFADLHRNIVPNLSGMLELGWVLSPHAHGRGYASEAVQAITNWAQLHFADRRMVCIISPENQPSLRVAEKGGFHLWQETTYHGDPILVFSR